MARRLCASALLFLVVLGCSKKKEDGGGGGEVRGVDGDPDATYTLKIRPVAKGDRYAVTSAESSSTTIEHGGKSRKVDAEKQFEYTEEVLELADGSAAPARLTRAYKVARRTSVQSKPVEPLSYQGKTVLIERVGKNYRYTVDGKHLPPAETLEFDAEFRDIEHEPTAALLPKRPVKVGESWPVDPAEIRFLGTLPGANLSKSSLSCTLKRAYTLDGKQWGVIAVEFTIALDPARSGGEGTLRYTGTLDAVVDGSSREGTIKGTQNLTHTALNGAKTTADGSTEKTVKSVK
jgi:hypothetical protein